MGRCLCGGCCQLSRPSRKQLVGSNGVVCNGFVLFESLLYSVELGSSAVHHRPWGCCMCTAVQRVDTCTGTVLTLGVTTFCNP